MSSVTNLIFDKSYIDNKKPFGYWLTATPPKGFTPLKETSFIEAPLKETSLKETSLRLYR